MKLIDADAAIDAFDKLCDTNCVYSKKQRAVMCGACLLGSAFDVIDDAPTVDAVEVVRCKDCKYSHMTFDGECKYCDIWFPNEKTYMDGDYFCASAERRQKEQSNV